MPTARVPKLSEAEFTRQVIRLAQLRGWRTAHFLPGCNRRGQWRTAVQGDGAGFPDLVLVRHAVIVAELKVGTDVRPDQRDWLRAFEAAGVPAYTWRPADWPEIEAVLGR